MFVITYGIFDESIDDKGRKRGAAFSNFFPEVSRGGAYVLLIFLILFLSVLEGFQTAILDMQRKSFKEFEVRFPRAAELHRRTSGEFIHKTWSFLVGRQTLVLVTVFFIAMLTSFPRMDKFPYTNSKMPYGIQVVFFGQGILSAVTILVMAQLGPRLIAIKYPVQMMNIPGGTFILELTFLIDKIGIVSFPWLLLRILEKVFGLNYKVTERLNMEDSRKNIAAIDPNDEEEILRLKMKITNDEVDPKERFVVNISKRDKFGKIIKYTISTLLNLACVIIIFCGLIVGQSGFTHDLEGNGIGGLFLLVILIFYLGFLEGGQAAIYSLSNKSTRTYQDKYKRAAALHAAIKDELPLERYVIGRQLMTLFTNFITANLTAFPVMAHFPWMEEFTFGVVFRFFLATGLIGAFFSLNWGAVAPEIVAAKYPIQYFNTPFLKFTVWSSWFFEFLGIANASFLYGEIVGFPFDRTVTERVRREIEHSDDYGVYGTTEWWEKMPNYSEDLVPGELDLAFRATETDLVVPNFLLPNDHPNYLPPYWAAVKLLNTMKEEPMRSQASKIVFPHKKEKKNEILPKIDLE